MNTEIRSAEDYFDAVFGKDNIARETCCNLIRSYHNQFKSDVNCKNIINCSADCMRYWQCDSSCIEKQQSNNEVLDKAIDWCKSQMDFYSETDNVVFRVKLDAFNSCKHYLESLKK